MAGLTFRRSSDNHLLTGTAGGLAEVTGIDPTVVRMAFVVLTLGFGLGLLAYLFAWAVSSEPSREPQLARLTLTTSPLR